MTHLKLYLYLSLHYKDTLVTRLYFQ